MKVIQDGCWPFPKTLPNFNLPSCLEQSVKDFTDFYEEKEGRKRRLKWFYHHSQADVKTCRTKRMYVLKVMTFQLGILHCFNSQDQLTIAEIREETALDMKVQNKKLKNILKIKGIAQKSATIHREWRAESGEWFRRVDTRLVDHCQWWVCQTGHDD